MPSFDVVSEVDTHELTNAIDQANRELATRFDFKGVDAKFERDGDVINQFAPTEFQLKQMNDILRARRPRAASMSSASNSATSRPTWPRPGRRSPSSRASSRRSPRRSPLR